MKNLDSIIPVSDEGLYPIRTVSELSGVNSITLRAWERRYGLFNPKRTPKGHRLYSEKDIQRVHQVLELLAKGVSIGRVAKALKEEQTVTNVHTIGTGSVSTKNLSKEEWKSQQVTLLKRINSYDNLQLEIFHHELLSNNDMETVIEDLIRPVLQTLSDRATQLPSLSADYYFYKMFLLHRIGGLYLKSSIQNSGKKILLMGVENTENDIELLLFSMHLLKHGYQVIILGCGLSFDAIPMALNASNSDCLLLFSCAYYSNKVTTKTFQTLVNSLNSPVFITGQYSEHQAKGLTDSGLFILPDNYKKQVEMIDKNLDKVTK